MLRPARFTASLFGLGLIGLGFALPAFAAEPQASSDDRALQADLRIEMYYGGLTLGHVDMTTQLSGQDYAMGAELRTGSLVGLFFDYFADMKSEGELEGTDVSPHRYTALYGTGDEVERETTLTFENKMGVNLKADPPYDIENVAAKYPEEERAGAIDPLSAALFGATALMKDGLCQGTIKVFDGRRRYNLKLSYVGSTNLSSRKSSRYSGPAEKCELVFERLRWKEGDFSKTPKSSEFGPYDIWFAKFPAPDGGAPMIAPVKFVMPLEYGAVVAHMSQFEMKPLEDSQEVSQR